VLFYLRGLPTFPNSEVGKEPEVIEPAFANSFGPPTLLHEVYMPPSRAQMCPECVYIFLEHARVLQNAGQFSAALDKLETARRIWVDKRVWPILERGLDPFAVRKMADACLRREVEEEKLRKEWEQARQQEILNRRKEREAKEQQQGKGGSTVSRTSGSSNMPNSPRSSVNAGATNVADGAESDLDINIPLLPPQLMNKSEVQLAREAEEREAKRLCAMSGSATPEEELEFYVYLWLSIASVYQSAGDDKQALLHVWKARVAIAEYAEMIEASSLNKELARRLRKLRNVKNQSAVPEDDDSDDESDGDYERYSDIHSGTATTTRPINEEMKRAPFPLAVKLRPVYKTPSFPMSSSMPNSPTAAGSQNAHGLSPTASSSTILSPKHRSQGSICYGSGSLSPDAIDIFSVNLYESDGEDDGGNPPFTYAAAQKVAAQTVGSELTPLGLPDTLENLGLKSISAAESKRAMALKSVSSPESIDKATAANVPAKDELVAELNRLGLSPSQPSRSAGELAESKLPAAVTAVSSIASGNATSMPTSAGAALGMAQQNTIPHSITDLVLWSCDQPRFSHQRLEPIDVLDASCSPVLASVFDALGTACARLNEIPLALACYRAAKDIRFKCIPPSSIEFADVGITLNNIGVCLTSLRRPKEALAYFYAALDAFTPRIESTHPRINAVTHNIERVRSMTNLVKLDLDALRAAVQVPGQQADGSTAPAAMTAAVPSGSASDAEGAKVPGQFGIVGVTRQIKLTTYQKLLVQYNQGGAKKVSAVATVDDDSKKAQSGRKTSK